MLAVVSYASIEKSSPVTVEVIPEITQNNIIQLQCYDCCNKNNKKTRKGTNKQRNQNKTGRATINIEKCGVLLISPSILLNLKDLHIFDQNLPVITLSMAKRLFNSIFSGCIKSVQCEIDIVNYYIKKTWESYKSYRKKAISKLKKYLNLQNLKNPICFPEVLELFSGN